MKTYRSSNTTAWMLVCILAVVLATALCGALQLAKVPAMHPASPAPAQPAPPKPTQAATIPARPFGGHTLSDAAARIELAGNYRAGSSRDLITQVLPDTYDAAKWREMGPVNPKTGEAIHGWFARDLFTSMDYEMDPAAFDGTIKDSANQLAIIQDGGTLQAQLTMIGEEDVDWDYTQPDFPYVVLNVVFDLPSNKHKYMQLVGLPATRGGIIISPQNVPELFAQTMTSTYMHIYVPLIGHADTHELMFYNQSFKDLLPAEDRAQAQAAMVKADQ